MGASIFWHLVQNKIQSLKATLMMIACQLIVAALSISYKVASNDGMHVSILITYRYLVSSFLILPLALIIERNKRPKLTWKILFQGFLCAIFGGPMSQNLFAQSLILTSPTFTAAFTNLVPPITFFVAVMFGMEKVGIGKSTGKAKVVGTLVAVGGAMLLTFYKGQPINILSTHFNILHGGQRMDGHVATSHKTSSHQIMGAVLALAYSLAVAVYFSVQGKMSANYPCHYSNSFMFSVFGFIQSFVYVVSTERSWSQWKLGWNIRLLCVIFQGIGSLAAVVLIMAAVHLQGPLFGSVFSPLVLVFVAIAGFLLLDENLHVGTVIGSVIIVVGLYVVLWGKNKEIKRLSKLTPSGSAIESNDTLNTTNNTTLKNVSMAGASSLTDNEGNDQLHMKYPRENQKEQKPVEEV
ncbi:eamA domain, WAT1-related protein [Artemisia annua]|uniref:WAT1-related protein n=1 Tax=Artemisia annua TaxID=35608 RepID=A0A2U1Q712_ARTAN|nr:eamA domain, WAT1-related protein [Artemisia annua]